MENAPLFISRQIQSVRASTTTEEEAFSQALSILITFMRLYALT